MKIQTRSHLPMFAAVLATFGLNAHCGGTAESSEDHSATLAEALTPYGIGEAPFTNARTVYAVDTQNVLIRFQEDAPDAVVTVGPITNLPGGQLIGIDFDPFTGLLYGVVVESPNSYSVHFIERWTATAYRASGATRERPIITPPATAFGIDFFPPSPGLAVVHSNAGQLLAVDTGLTPIGPPFRVAFAPGDPLAGRVPNFVGTAFSNNVNPPPSDFTQTRAYVIDSEHDILATSIEGDQGIFFYRTVGNLGVDVGDNAGFDIVGGQGGQIGDRVFVTPVHSLAALVTPDANQSGLYQINLETGAATLVGPINHPLPIVGLAIDL